MNSFTLIGFIADDCVLFKSFRRKNNITLFIRSILNILCRFKSTRLVFFFFGRRTEEYIIRLSNGGQTFRYLFENFIICKQQVIVYLRFKHIRIFYRKNTVIVIINFRMFSKGIIFLYYFKILKIALKN